jgi:2',3'-cyclic-nucleotide 2'-phosphodiesterase (5'-nucleotidase family)
VDNINVAILGIGNPRIPNYELPSNIPGLSFSDPITKAQELSTTLRSTNDVVIALSHLGFTDPTDPWVDTYMASHTTGIDAIIGGHSHTDPSGLSLYSYLGTYKYLPTVVSAQDGKPVVINQALRYNNTLGEVVIGLRAKLGGGYEVVSQTGRYLVACANGKTGSNVNCALDTPEDAATKAIIDPYAALLTAYNNTTVGKTTAPIDTNLAFTQETNGANLQADASVYELKTKHGLPVDFHLSGAMTNKLFAAGATPASPVTLKISDMFAGMPYENSLLVISMNGPQLKTVLERAYRNYYYYKYDPIGHGGYSYYTTCMLDTNFGNQIKYNDLYPALPNGDNVVSLKIAGAAVDFSNASKYYNVSTVNYLAAGSCNFNDAGVSLWPLNQIVSDTQYYVRDAVIDYTTFKGIVSPAIEGRLQFVTDSVAPIVSSIVRANANPSTALNVNYTVTFSEPVTGVDAADFVLTASGVSGASITGVSGSGSTYTISAYSGMSAGTLRLDVVATPSIKDLTTNSLVGPYTTGQFYTLRTTIFADVSASYWANSSINSLYNAGITTGCGGGNFCPETAVTRAQMAVFLVRAMHGSSFVPPTATGLFTDVPVGAFGADYIEQLAADGITSGCGGGNFCPNTLVKRDSMAIFLVRAKHGIAFVPPTATGVFADVPVGSFGANYIEQLAADGITSGCGGGNYCPTTVVTRAQMAVFLVKTFNLP